MQPPFSLLNAQGRLRHAHGNGSMFDNSEADSESFINLLSEVHGASEIRESYIENSIIDNAVVFESNIKDSHIQRGIIAGKNFIKDSNINCDFILGNALISQSNLQNKVRVWGNPSIEKVQIRNVSVFGTETKLIGEWSLDGCMGRIGQGTWTRPPRVVRFESLGITITESLPGYAYVGCRLHSLDWWFRAGNKIGKAAGWTEHQIETLRELFNHWSQD